MARYNGEHPSILIGVPVFQGWAVVAETLNSIRNQDFPVVQCAVVLLATLIVIVNLVVDVCVGLLDPRIRVGG